MLLKDNAGKFLDLAIRVFTQASANADLHTAAKLARAQGQTEDLQRSLKALRILGATENP